MELAGQLRELATHTLRAEFRHIRPEDARVLLFDGGPAPLAGVLRYEAGTVLWTAGVEAPPVAAALAARTGAQRDRTGRILVDSDLTIPGHPKISVGGDLMCLQELPAVAEVAMQSGRYAAQRIRHRLAGDTVIRSFRYRDFGSAAYISRGRAVVSAGPLHFAGILGWLAWLFIHIGFLTGFRNRVGALLSWGATFARESRRERAFTTHQIGMLSDSYPSRSGRTGSDTTSVPQSPPP